MTLTVDLPADVVAQLTHQAQAQGKPLHEYVRALLVDFALPAADTLGTEEEWAEDMRALAEGSESLPVLPPEAFSRESIYDERG